MSVMSTPDNLYSDFHKNECLLELSALSEFTAANINVIIVWSLWLGVFDMIESRVSFILL
ncbi:hypothetical protein RO3G_08977 [Rhizopus delemar RA 99-880]|uniref:Uncharacterized protein n=1 Tax=Rhizopus delemar (strain RA 99-880 / ATCC MYA-4621 / FGSC 9543 / NRRL 43880) TaxID=246409 RepID=I1C737_RHIO9|nr:hypothetical protein RO3G_08977 [Rhizopus delemar RA 99-880]|eukprot:EIE84267.1 hypothetical protein RO3G_08977 [Rhizopus delemar RA 99-880]